MVVVNVFTQGPPTAAPVESHYGSCLIRDLIPHELGGTVDLMFPPDGACCTIEIPLKRRVRSERQACTKTALEIKMSAGR
jgi:two-component sensor histidine kinase